MGVRDLRWSASPEWRVLVGHEGGRQQGRSVRRTPEEDRWSKDCTDWVKHVPWHLYKGHPEADGKIPEENIAETHPGIGETGQTME